MRSRLLLRIAALLLTVCTLCTLCSCSFISRFMGGDKNAPTDFQLADAEGKGCTIIYPDGASNAEWRTLSNRLARAVKRVTGATPDVKSDSEAEGERELLVGPTNRAASTAAIAALEKNALTFSFTVTGGKLVLAAADAMNADLAVAYFEAQATGKLCGVKNDKAFLLPGTLALTHTVLSPTVVPADLLTVASGIGLRTDDAFTVPTSGNCKTFASLAVWNDTVYAALRDGNGNAKLLRYDRTTEKQTKASEVLALGDAVSMTYNPIVDLLVVAHGKDKKVSMLDPESLALMYTVTLDEEVEAVAFDPEGLRLAVKHAGNQDICFYDGALAQKLSFTLTGVDSAKLSSGAVTLADMATDGKFFYLLYAVAEGEGEPQSLLVSLAADGSRRLLTKLTASTPPLSLSFSGRVFYAAFGATENGCAAIKRITISSTEVANEPFALFNADNTATVDTSYLSSTRLFYVRNFIKEEFSRNNVLQGACTDGVFGYYFLEYQGGTGNYSNSHLHDTVIVKVDMETRQMVAHSAPLPLGHSNDGCYNPHTKKLLVVYNGNAAKRVIAVDPGTLLIDEAASVTLDINIFAMSYNEQTGQYIVGRSGGRNVGILDENFNLIKTYETGKLGAEVLFSYTNEGDSLLTQGIDADSKYIYFVLSGKRSGESNWTNYLVAFDYDGNHAFTKVLPNMTNEVENMFHIGSKIYIGCNGGSSANRNPCYELTVAQVP